MLNPSSQEEQIPCRGTGLEKTRLPVERALFYQGAGRRWAVPPSATV
jgi:hypothetical protein